MFSAYEHMKRTFKDTAQQCAQVGLKFTPLMVESHEGSWSPLARSTLDTLAKAQSAAWLEGQEPASLRIAQRISCTLQRESARAILRRLAHPVSHPVAAGWGGEDFEVTV